MNDAIKTKEAPGSERGGLNGELPPKASTSDGCLSSHWTLDEIYRRHIVLDGSTALCSLRKGIDENLRRWAGTEGRLLRITGQAAWGNPFPVRDGRPGTDRNTVFVSYWDYLRSTPSLLARLPDLRGKVLACSCPPRRCHGHEIIRMMILRKMIPQQELPPLGRDDRYRPTRRELLRDVRRAIRKAGGRILCWENGRILFVGKEAVHE